MPLCKQRHYGLNRKAIPHVYIAGICLNTVSEGSQAYLRATYPWLESNDYEKSKIGNWGKMLLETNEE
jgi:hypothetical protein